MTEKNKKFSDLFYNAVTYAGVMIGLVFAAVEIFLFILDFIDKGRNLYLGLVTYLILPAVILFGLFLIPLGVFWKKSRIKRGLPNIELKRFRIDLSLAHHRNALLVFIVGTSILMLMSLVGAYKAFHYTESVKFCGALCHEIMSPEYTAYQKSPHGRVKCVECHIGAGADWYVRSKLSGTRQVFKAAAHSFERPIKTPVKDLRPAEETCKQCHWPGKFFGTLDFKRTYYSSDESVSPWQVRMLLNIGGGDHQTYGVHAHMNVNNEMFYAAEDEQRQNITWVKSIGKDEKEIVYVSPKSKWKNTTPPADRIRKMDCIDCHNRPTHQFSAPYRLVNDAMQYGQIDASIPKIKEKAMEALSKQYKTQNEAITAIEDNLRGYYKSKQSDYYKINAAKVDAAIKTVIELFSKNMFPEMKARWDTHPDNIGHLVSPGCFRCHDGEHRAVSGGVTPPPDLSAVGEPIPSESQKSSGGVISRNCKSCHLIVEQGPKGQTEKNIDGLEFRHPAGGEEWKEMNCIDCHSGGA